MIKHKKIYMKQVPNDKEMESKIENHDGFIENENFILKDSLNEKISPNNISQINYNKFSKDNNDDLFSLPDENIPNENSNINISKLEYNSKLNDEKLYDQIVSNRIILEEIIENKKEENKQVNEQSKNENVKPNKNEQKNDLLILNNTFTIVTNINSHFQSIQNSQNIEDFNNFFYK